MSGKLIVLYGINNLGKSTQARLLVEQLNAQGFRAAYLKYPLYDLEPSGPLINAYLRGGNPHLFTPREFQIMQVMNRSQYDSELRARLAAGEWIVAEDYVGTGIAWGMGAGIDRALLEKMNTHLLKEDLGILFEGKRFLEAKEPSHRFETDDALTELVRKAHDELGETRGWKRVNANDAIPEVKEAIWNIVKNAFSL